MKTRESKTSAAAIDRRRFIAGSASVSAAIFVSGAAIIHPGEAWGLEVKTLAPATMHTLVKAARDIYPHDRLIDKYYALAVKGYDAKAAEKPELKALIEGGVADLDKRAMTLHGVRYVDIGWEAPRVEILREIEGGPFFIMIRSGLVVSLYNQKEIWPLFGYQGESASEGGYINRGFNDLNWL
ncbi:conserved hypothetical protein [Methylocella silvestris BL2]|uniref:Twin-arginine translocation pathway signal n=1 Tax=Methylocella silvestris (strain DSM 15510 / CIP 108128 / LMG 27833 / NCIMB 13906 / BL2) TaxID=395965 RepID=B8EK50_METSB|nr:conserved hypothetical protein [Methylocella silvestris BL2]